MDQHQRSVNNLKPVTDTSKYNLRCNRNISEKMTKKDFVYDIPAPFQAMRKEKGYPSPVKKSRGNFECVGIQQSEVSPSEEIVSKDNGTGRRTVTVVDGKVNKNQVGLLRLIQPRKLLPAVVTTGTYNYGRSNPQSVKEGIIKEREVDSTETEEYRRQIVLPIQIRRKIGPDSKTTRYSLPERRKILGYQCNYCLERVATLLSLSTHVKYHRQIYCATCFWVLEHQESMIQHIQKAHPADRRGLNTPEPPAIVRQ